MNGIVQIGCLGNLGRFGNCLFQYAFARGYAESIGARLETPPWIGQKIFEGIADPAPSVALPTLGVDEFPGGRTNVNLWGYFQYDKCFKFYTLSKLRQWFKIKPALVEKYGSQRRSVVAHVRRGDYLTVYKDIFCSIGYSAYTKALLKHGYSNVITVSEDSCRDPIDDKSLEFLPDFLTLCNCDVLFRANSTFSWWAGTLGSQLRIFSPVVDGLRGMQQDNVEFVEGNLPRCVDLPNVHDYNIEP